MGRRSYMKEVKPVFRLLSGRGRSRDGLFTYLRRRTRRSEACEVAGEWHCGLSCRIPGNGTTLHGGGDDLLGDYESRRCLHDWDCSSLAGEIVGLLVVWRRVDVMNSLSLARLPSNR